MTLCGKNITLIGDFEARLAYVYRETKNLPVGYRKSYSSPFS